MVYSFFNGLSDVRSYISFLARFRVIHFGNILHVFLYVSKFLIVFFRHISGKILVPDQG
jgi:hypothetical protein